ncbi:MAG: flagellar hook-associated protein FlgK [Pseudomonadales bacterium]|nr:flagellar hook-associated protein FlgK [Pseudomonadales bacterium]
MASIFSIGISGLNTAQMGLQTTSNNISNVNTPGYNRELVVLVENESGGARVDQIQRQFNLFVADQLNNASSDLAGLRSNQLQVSQLDNIFADSDAGLAPLMQNFFGALQGLSSAPSDVAARQGVIGAADSLTSQFRALDNFLNNMQEGLNSQIQTEVSQINSFSTQIANLNREISVSQARNGEAPNALLNQRDRLVAELSQHLDIKLQIQDGTNYNITAGDGQTLVIGNRHSELVAIGSAADPTRLVVGFVDSAGNTQELAEDVFKAGSLGGLMSFRTETLDGVQNQVGHMAVTLAQAMNLQHQAGTDLNGNPGQDFFAIGAPRTIDHANNTGTAAVSATFTDIPGLVGAEYDLRVSDAATGEFTVVRRDNGQSFTANLDVNNELAFDGLLVNVDDPTLLADGDSYRLQPVRRAAAEIETLVRDTAEVAAAQAGGSGDNRNALAMLDLQNAKLLRGNTSLTQAYMTLISDVGNRAGILSVSLSAQESITLQLQQLQQSESGVNLDEEAVNLIRYQQFFQANARVIETGSTILDTILGL